MTIAQPVRRFAGTTAGKIADSLKLGAAKRDAMKRQILQRLVTSYEHEVDRNAAKLGLKRRIKLSPDSREYKRLAAIAEKHATSIINTDAKFLDSLAEQLADKEDGILQRFKDALRERWGTKDKPGNRLQMIRDVTESTGSMEAVARIVGLQEGLRVHFGGANPDSRTDPECAFIQLDEPHPRGYDSEVAERNPTPIHPRCVRRGSLVEMRRGKVPIEMVQVGDEVMTHSGDWRKVSQTSSRRLSGQVLRLRVGLFEVVLSDEHPVLTKRGWIQARELKAGEICVVSRVVVRDTDDKV